MREIVVERYSRTLKSGAQVTGFREIVLKDPYVDERRLDHLLEEN